MFSHWILLEKFEVTPRIFGALEKNLLHHNDRGSNALTEKYDAGSRQDTDRNSEDGKGRT